MLLRKFCILCLHYSLLVLTTVTLHPFEYDSSSKYSHKFMVQSIVAPEGSLDDVDELVCKYSQTILSFIYSWTDPSVLPCIAVNLYISSSIELIDQFCYTTVELINLWHDRLCKWLFHNPRNIYLYISYFEIFSPKLLILIASILSLFTESVLIFSPKNVSFQLWLLLILLLSLIWA